MSIQFYYPLFNNENSILDIQKKRIISDYQIG